MTIKSFPPIELADPQTGLIAVGGDLEVESLLLAYRSGIFPWPVSNEYLTWFAPQERAVLFLDDYHASRSLLKEVKRTRITHKINHNFRAVIDACSSDAVRKKEKGSWLTQDMIEGYTALFNAGYAYSVESYMDDVLVGGFYGVIVNGFISAESMFHHKPNASKLALHFFVEHLRAKAVTWIDFQALNDFTETLGAIEIEREQFMKLLEEELKKSDFSIIS